MKISLAMIVKNEERCIERCLMSVKDIVDEMIVVDTGSIDKTKEIAKKCGANVFDFEWVNDFSEARNFSLNQTTGDWILVLDADEFFVSNYKKPIQEFIEKGPSIGKVNIISNFDADGEAQENNSFTSRLFPRGIQYKGSIHEQLVTDLPRFDLDVEVHHDGYFQTDKSSRNIQLLMHELIAQPEDSYFLYQLGKEYRSQKQFNTARQYFAKSYQFTTKNFSFYPNLIVEYLNSLKKSNYFDTGLTLIEKEKQNLSFFSDFFFAVGSFHMEYLQHVSEPELRQLLEIESAYLTCLQIGENPKFNGVRGTGSFLAAYNLGVYYEVLSQLQKAKEYYSLSARHGYPPAQKRLISFP